MALDDRTRSIKLKPTFPLYPTHLFEIISLKLNFMALLITQLKIPLGFAALAGILVDELYFNNAGTLNFISYGAIFSSADHFIWMR